MKTYLSIISLFFISCAVMFAQDDAEMRSHVRSGNKLFRDSLFADAEMEYRRALAINETDTVALFNLANALIWQQDQAKIAEADSLLQIVTSKAEQECNRGLASQCFYQHGEIAMLAQQYDQAVTAYKEALKRNPKDDNARFNYLLAKKLLQQQQNQDQNQDNQQDQQKQDQQQQQQQDQQQNQQQNNQNNDQQNPQQDQQDQQQQQQQMSQDQLQSILEQNEREEKETQAKVARRQQEKDDEKKKEMEMRRRNGTLKDW